MNPMSAPLSFLSAFESASACSFFVGGIVERLAVVKVVSVVVRA
ncbi:hypothetical protein [Candidatus Protochlamydia phocaeensis]|nr:hypothetical protein [Candidatus Protochlamydia phocaeensis]